MPGQLETSGARLVRRKLSTADPGAWRPNNLAEYEATARLEIVLPLIAEQARSDRKQRERVALAVFATLILQSLGMFGLMVAIGLKALEFPSPFYTYVMPSWFLEMAGMAYFIVRSLFASNSLGLLDRILAKTGRGPEDNSARAPSGGGDAKASVTSDQTLDEALGVAASDP